MARRTDWLPYDVVRNWALKVGIRSYDQYREFASTRVLPPYVPRCPRNAYPDQWVSDTEFFEGRIPKHLPYDAARAKVKRIGIRSQKEYLHYCKEFETDKVCAKLPRYPHRTYAEFNGWGEFLGRHIVAKQHIRFLPYEEAKAFVHALGVKDSKGWYEWANRSKERPSNIPSNPWDTYKDEWNGMREWVGSNLTARMQTQAVNNAVLCISQTEWAQPNEFTYATFPAGATQALIKCKEANLRVVALFEHDPKLSEHILHTIEDTSSSHYDQSFVTMNWNELMYRLTLSLKPVQISSADPSIRHRR